MGPPDYISDDGEFVDEDYRVEVDDEDYEETVTRDKNAKSCRKTNGNVVAAGTFTVDVPIDGENVEEYDYSDDSELHSIYSDSDCENSCGNVRDGLEFIAEKHLDNPNLQLGLKFRNFVEFKQAVKVWGIRNRYQPYFPTNDRKRCIARCCKEKKSCKFYIYAANISSKESTVQIKTLRLQHTCGKVFKNFHLNPKWLADKFVGHFRANPTCSDAGLIDMIQRETTYKISRAKAWRVKDLCMKRIYGDEAMQYEKLISYKLDLELTNLGSVVELWVERTEFRGFFVCLSPLKEAFKRFLRPIICLDGCWLKGTYEGQLLSAVCIDPNDCIYPVAWAVVLTESRQTWTWFLQLLQMSLDLNNSYSITFMSDRQKGLIGAVKDLFPNAEHRHCVRHMYTNFRGKHPGKELKDIIWKATRSTYPERFNKAMDELKENSVEARACYILDTRDKAIISMLEMIKNRIMKRIYTKAKVAEKWSCLICPKVIKKIEKIAELLPLYVPTYSGGPNVSVEGAEGPYICNMRDKVCICRRWQISGLPCAHALAAIVYNNENINNYVSLYYSTTTYKEVYRLYINPTNNCELWTPDNSLSGLVLPPKRKKKCGRKPMKRRLEAEEIEAASAKKTQEAAERRSRLKALHTSEADEQQSENTTKRKE